MATTRILKAVVISEDKGTLHLGIHTESGTTYQSITNPALIRELRQASQGMPGQPSEIEITINPAK